MNVKEAIRKITKMYLFLPIFSMLLVMAVNIIFDIATGNAAFGFFSITIKKRCALRPYH